jgi:predicted dehydrogenase
VVVEKPFVPTSAEADRLIALAKEKGKILTVFQSQLYPSVQHVLELCLSGLQTGDSTATSGPWTISLVRGPWATCCRPTCTLTIPTQLGLGDGRRRSTSLERA